MHFLDAMVTGPEASHYMSKSKFNSCFQGNGKGALIRMTNNLAIVNATFAMSRGCGVDDIGLLGIKPFIDISFGQWSTRYISNQIN